ncbi:hypothetical protein DRB87_04510 [Pandoraea sp. XY-2]|nr:hypothetical protein DRB87_04510 [Pandoraea sp. XY-2]
MRLMGGWGADFSLQWKRRGACVGLQARYRSTALSVQVLQNTRPIGCREYLGVEIDTNFFNFHVDVGDGFSQDIYGKCNIQAIFH